MTSQKSSRLLDLEKKKEKLAALRAEKARQEGERRQTLLQPIQNVNKRQTTTQEELDLLLKSVGITEEKEETHVSPREKCENIFDKPSDVFVKPLSPALVKVKTEIKTEKTAEHANPHLLPHSLFPPIPKKEINIYSKGVQTDEIEVDAVPIIDGFNNDIQPLSSIIEDLQKELVVPETNTQEKLERLTEEEKQNIMNQIEFQVFFCNASRIMAKQLELRKDREAFTSYTKSPAKSSGGELLKLACEYKDPKWTNNREIAAMEFSIQYKELVAVAYGPNEKDSHSWRGVVCIWNCKFRQQPPEFLLYCGQQLTSITFDSFNQHLILGGCAAGPIVVWDRRIVHKKTPTHHTPISVKAHTAPVYSLHYIRVEAGQILYSISSDGNVCSWNPENLTFPKYCNEFQCCVQGNKTRSVPTTSACFNPDNKSFIVGSEDGLVMEYQVNDVTGIIVIKDIPGKQPEVEIPKINATMSYEAEGKSPVLAIHFHVAAGAFDFSHLFLASSFDWSIKLYSTKEPLFHMRFDTHQDAVVDVKWSPVHPAVFASIDQTGTFCIWNLNENVDDPVLAIKIQDGKERLKKLAWSQDGQNICVGDSNGSVFLYACDTPLYVVKNDVFYKLAERLAQVKQDAEMK